MPAKMKVLLIIVTLAVPILFGFGCEDTEYVLYESGDSVFVSPDTTICDTLFVSIVDTFVVEIHDTITVAVHDTSIVADTVFVGWHRGFDARDRGCRTCHKKR
jgi:hypothetical protein